MGCLVFVKSEYGREKLYGLIGKYNPYKVIILSLFFVPISSKIKLLDYINVMSPIQGNHHKLEYI